jgi:TusA-related sulfurtransferase
LSRTVKSLDFTWEGYKGCREKPSVKLVTVIMESQKGDVLEVVGEDEVFPFDMLTETLRDEGFEVEVLERDELVGFYRVRAVKA